MSHLTETRWHGYATEPRRVELAIASTLAYTDVASAELRIAGLPVVTLTPQTATGGYELVGDVTLPAAGFYRWAAEVTDGDGNTPIVVAAGVLNVEARIAVATP